MHDIDSTRLETGPDQGEYQYDTEFSADPHADRGGFSLEMPMTEEDEETLTAELLGVSSEDEMDQFLGKLFGKIKRGIRGASQFLSKNGLPLSSVLKGLAKRGLPFAASALGAAVPIPGLGAILNSSVAKATANLLESETEQLEEEEREYRMAKRFVRLATQTVRQGVRMPTRYNPSAAVNLALRNALQGWQRAGGFRARPIYLPCPPCAPCPPPEPCPTCPTCAQALPAPNSPDVEPGPGPTGAPPGPSTATGTRAGSTGETESDSEGGGEFDGTREQEDAGELPANGEFQESSQGEGDGETYESDHEFLAATNADRGRAGRWVRRGRKIVLYGL